jgi:serine/threonine-protein kinase
VAELLEHLKAQLQDRYDVERELGRGGMATVFLAKDVKHGRPVAIKVLHEDLAAALGAERFRREIQIATSLSHPHILPLYDSGEAGGSLYYVMPYVEGESLRHRIDREKQLQIEEALRITLEVASALDYAHRRNIVHRDIKPENILIEEGHAIVADFGIARAVTSMASAGPALTQTGVSLGTPTYMSPEQSFAEKEIDGRSDEYSLACVLYEMLTGQPPFTGPNAQAIMARHSMAAVPSMQIVRNTIPDEVEDAVQKALAKSPADRFPTLADFGDELKECVIDYATTTRRATTRSMRQPVPSQKRRPKWIVPAGIGLSALIGISLVAWSLWGRPRGAAASGDLAPNNVAVLYFDDVSSGGKLAYLADGLTENLIDRLSNVTGLDVISKSGVGLFRGKDVSVDSVVSALRVGTLVRGTVEDLGNRLRVGVRLVDGNSGDVLERATFEQPMANVLAAQDTLAMRVADFLRKRVGSEVRLRSQRSATSNSAAWTLLQRAEKLRKDADSMAAKKDESNSTRSYARADSLLAQAEQLDPSWVDPIVERARVALSQARAADEPNRARPAIEAGLAAANRAVAKAPRDADALTMRGSLQFRKWELQLTSNTREADQVLGSAESDLKAAIAIDPTLADAHNLLSAVYNQQDQLLNAKLEAQRAYEQDAFLEGTDKLLWRLFGTSYDLQQWPDAETYCNQGAQRFPGDVRFVRCKLLMLTTPYVRQPNIAAAWADYDKLKAITPPLRWEFVGREAKMLVAAGILKAGLQDSARHVLVAARGNSQVDAQGELYAREAFIRTLFGTSQDTDEAIELLKRYFAVNPTHRKGFRETDHWWWKPLKEDARFRELVAG